MRFVHLSDLHIGKRINEVSMLEDQEYILTKIINIIDEVKPDGVIIAGDVYDKSIPSAEAVSLFDDFLYKLSVRKQQVFVISGNHDSAERIAFGGRLMDQSGIHMSPVYTGGVDKFVMEDEFGPVNVYMLPFIKPAHVRKIYEEVQIDNYTDALGVAIENMGIDTAERNILVCHQFVTGATRSDSEEISVGGLDNVDVEVFDDFDYVALGHIHGPQKIKRDTVRYSGTPLKYSLSEANQKKSVTMIDILEKGKTEISFVELEPRRDLRRIKGLYGEITEKSFLDKQKTDDYVYIVLTDEDDITNARGVLKDMYPNMLELRYDNTRTRALGYEGESADVETKSELELFSELFEIQNGQPMSKEQSDFVASLIERIKEEQ